LSFIQCHNSIFSIFFLDEIVKRISTSTCHAIPLKKKKKVLGERKRQITWVAYKQRIMFLEGIVNFEFVLQCSCSLGW